MGSGEADVSSWIPSTYIAFSIKAKILTSTPRTSISKMEQVRAPDMNAPAMMEDEEVEVKEMSQLQAERSEYDQLQVHFDAKRDQKLLRKIDLRLLPTLATFYLVAFVDRSNIGNARLQHLEEDLLISPQQFSWYNF